MEEHEAASSYKPSARTSTDGVGHAVGHSSDRMQRRVRCSPGSNVLRACVFSARSDQHVRCVSLASPVDGINTYVHVYVRVLPAARINPAASLHFVFGRKALDWPPHACTWAKLVRVSSLARVPSWKTLASQETQGHAQVVLYPSRTSSVQGPWAPPMAHIRPPTCEHLELALVVRHIQKCFNLQARATPRPELLVSLVSDGESPPRPRRSSCSKPRTNSELTPWPRERAPEHPPVLSLSASARLCCACVSVCVLVCVRACVTGDPRRAAAPRSPEPCTCAAASSTWTSFSCCSVLANCSTKCSAELKMGRKILPRWQRQVKTMPTQRKNYFC